MIIKVSLKMAPSDESSIFLYFIDDAKGVEYFKAITGPASFVDHTIVERLPERGMFKSLPPIPAPGGGIPEPDLVLALCGYIKTAEESMQPDLFKAGGTA